MMIDKRMNVVNNSLVFRREVFINKYLFIKVLLSLFFLLHIVDIITTIVGFRIGLVEFNPFAARLFVNFGLWPTFFYGFLMLFFATLLIADLYYRNKKDEIVIGKKFFGFGKLILGLYLLLLIIIPLNNFLSIFSKVIFGG